jgi:hypothetical protein
VVPIEKVIDRAVAGVVADRLLISLFEIALRAFRGRYGGPL